MDKYSQFILGEHNTSFYESVIEKHEVLFSNLVAGLNNGCSLLYISSGEDVEHVKEELSNYGLRVDQPYGLKIVTSYEWYTPDGRFDPNRVVEQARGLLEKSLDRGFKGLYVSADASDTFDYLSNSLESGLRYENSFGRTFNFPVEAICAYRLNQALLSNEVFLQLILAHKNTVMPTSSVDNKLAYFRTVIDVLKSNFGEHATEIVFTHLEHQSKIYQDLLPDRVEDFKRSLVQIYSQNVTNMIMDRITKEFVQKELKIGIRYR